MTDMEQLRDLRRLWGGFWGPRVVLTANNLELFEALQEERTAAEAAKRIGADQRGMEILLNALAALELVQKREGRYRNAEIAEKFLVRTSPLYQGDMIRHADILWKNWSHLDEVVKSGKPARAAEDHESFIRAMHNNSVARASFVLDSLGLTGVGRALDLAGGPGTYSIEMARRGIDATLFDLPQTIPISREIAKEAGVTVSFIEGDVFKDSIGEGYDLILVSQLLHSFSEEGNRSILATCRDALRPGGRVAVHEFFVQEDLAGPAPGALFAVNMLVNTEGGRCYSPGEISRWLEESGLEEPQVIRLEESSLIVARRG